MPRNNTRETIKVVLKVFRPAAVVWLLNAVNLAHHIPYSGKFFVAF